MKPLPKDKARELYNHYYDNEFSVVGVIGKEDAKKEANFVATEIKAVLLELQVPCNYWRRVIKEIAKI